MFYTDTIQDKLRILYYHFKKYSYVVNIAILIRFLDMYMHIYIHTNILSMHRSVNKEATTLVTKIHMQLNIAIYKLYC